jgi:membrane protein required for colicin V production
MKTLDLLILLPLLLGAYNGYKRGFLLEIIAVVAFILAVVLGFKLMDVSLGWLSPYFNNAGNSNRFMPYFAFAIIFFPIIFLVNKLGSLLRRSLQYTLIGSFDSMAGAIVGIFTWAFGISVFLWLINAVGVLIPTTATLDTYLYPVIKPIAPTIISKASGLFPMGQDLIESIKKALENFDPGSITNRGN